MNTRRIALFFGTLLASITVHADQVTVSFFGASPPAVLSVYRELAQLELIESSDVTKSAAMITISSSGLIERTEAIKLLEKALAEQAGIVVTKLDGKRASVAYNDALLKKPAPEIPALDARTPNLAPWLPPMYSTLLLHTNEVLRIELNEGDIATIKFLSIPTQLVAGGPDEAKYRWELIAHNSKTVGTNSLLTSSQVKVGDLSFPWTHISHSIYIHADLSIGKFQKVKADEPLRQTP